MQCVCYVTSNNCLTKSIIMAKLLSIFGKIVGSVAGITFADSVGGGQVIKQKPKPPRRRARSIDEARSIFGAVSRMWQDLTLEQMGDWEDYAALHPVKDKLGSDIILSGSNWHMKLNAVKTRIWQNQSTTPPIAPPVSAVDELTLSGGGVGIIGVNWTELGTGVAADAWEVRVSPGIRGNGVQNFHGSMKSDGLIAGDVLTHNVDNLQVGMYYFIEVSYISLAGERTAWVRGKYLAPAA